MDTLENRGFWQRNANAVLTIYLLLIIFTPYIAVAGRDNFEITFVITLVFALFIPNVIKRLKNNENMVLRNIMLLLSAVLVLDTISLVNYIRVSGGIDNIIANGVPNAKVALYILIVIGVYGLNLSGEKFRPFINKFVPYIGIVLSIIGIFQHYNFLNFNNWFTKYYISSESGKVLIEVLKENQQWSRVLGTLSNPNFLSVELLIILVFVVSNIIYSKKDNPKLLSYISSALLFVVIIFTQSRTALIAMVFLLLYIVLMLVLSKQKRKAIIYLLVFVGVLGVSLLMIKILDLNYLFDAIQNGLSTRSITQRVDRWKDAISLFKLHPIIGIGPVIGTYFPAVDNEYIHILRNYGILGLASHLSFYIYVFIKTLKDIISSWRDDVKQYAFGVNLSILVILISNMTMATFYHWRNFVLLLVMCCMWAKLRNIEGEKCNKYLTETGEKRYE